jgi:hypothetical protein
MNAFFNRFRDRARIEENLRIAPNWRNLLPATHRREWIIRPDDLLVLDFDLHNLKVVLEEEGEFPVLARSGAGSAYLIVTFPPQNLAEEAFFETAGEEGLPVGIPQRSDKEKEIDPGVEDLLDPDAADSQADEIEPDDDALYPPPVRAQIAGWSRLVFRVRDEDLPIMWTLDGLLEAMGRLELNVPANALPPRLPLLVDLIDFGSLLKAKVIDGALLKELTPGIDFEQPAPLVAAPRGGEIMAIARERRRLRLIENRANGRPGTINRDLGVSVDTAKAITGIGPILFRPKPQLPDSKQTALELPFRLLVSPNRHGAWAHVRQPATSTETGHTELWHTRLGVRAGENSVDEGDNWLRSIRAVWAKDLLFDPQDPKEGPGHFHEPFRMSLDAFDRHNIVHLSSNFTLTSLNLAGQTTLYEPPVIEVDMLALTSLGAWLDSRGSWDFPQPKGLSVEEWRHRGTLGRDHYVRVVYAGFLYPWGHRASVIKVTERKFHDDEDERPAYLRQRMFLVVREPLKRYRTAETSKLTTAKGEQYNLMMPFREVRITTRVSPLLDDPKFSDMPGKLQSCFWPQVNKEDFQFDLIGTDTSMNEVEFSMPLVFVGKEFTDLDFEHPDSIVNIGLKGFYEKNDNVARRTADLLGQRVALAQSKAPDDTLFAVRSFTFGAEIPDLAVDFNKLPWQKPRFFPVVRFSKIDIPAVQAIARTNEPAQVVFADRYLKHDFESGNPGELFLAADPDVVDKLGVSFSEQGDRSGALITPDMTIEGLSRLNGPVAGDLENFSNNGFVPGDWFGALANAKLFGVFTLEQVLAGFGLHEQELLPSFVGKAMNEVEQFIAELERMEDLLKQVGGAQATAVKNDLDELLDLNTGSIPALFKDGDVNDVLEDLDDLSEHLDNLTGALDGMTDITAGPKTIIKETADRVQVGIGLVKNTAGLIESFANGDLLPESLDLRFEWRPKIKTVTLFGRDVFIPKSERNLLLAVQMSGEEMRVLCSLDDFIIDLYVVVLNFRHVQFRIDSGGKPEIDVRLKDMAEGDDKDGFQFAGPLSFVQTLRDVIPMDGFSDPPDVSVTPQGIEAGFSMGLPNLAVGVFSLENLAIAAGFSIPFIGPPLSTWFKFCTRENPSRLTVSLFGGGFFFGFKVNPDGLVILEGAIEFGASISVNLGIASGSVSAMAGLYFKIEGSDVTLAGYFRLRGEVSALGLVTVSVEVYLEMRYESASGKCVGTATIRMEVDVTLFSVTIEATVTKKFAGGGKNADPTFAETMDVLFIPDATSQPWETYCLAFA